MLIGICSALAGFSSEDPELKTSIDAGHICLARPDRSIWSSIPEQNGLEGPFDSGPARFPSIDTKMMAARAWPSAS